MAQKFVQLIVVIVITLGFLKYSVHARKVKWSSKLCELNLEEKSDSVGYLTHSPHAFHVKPVL